MSKEEIRAIVEHFASLAAVIRGAGPADKAEIYRGINLMLKYQPGAQIVQAKAQLTRPGPRLAARTAAAARAASATGSVKVCLRDLPHRGG
jgi:hypothetical protein